MTSRRRLEAATLGRLPVPARRGLALLLVCLLLPAAALVGAVLLGVERLPRLAGWLRRRPGAARRWSRDLGVEAWRVAVSVSDRWAPAAPPSSPLPDRGLPLVYSDTPQRQGPAGEPPRVPVRSWADCRCGVCRSMPAPCPCPCHEAVEL